MGTARIVVLAAGSSSRMRGGDKLLEPVDGEALLRRQTSRALATGARVLVTLPPDRPARAAALQGLAAEMRIVDGAAEGMAASLRVAADWADGHALLVLPADMPEIDTADLDRVLAEAAACPDAIWRGVTAGGRPGHPVVFPADLLAEVRGLDGDEGARSVLARHAARVRLVVLPGAHALTDLDTPEDWAAWRAGRKPDLP
jgi:molybdenum cofactor cytidylyltransferase